MISRPGNGCVKCDIAELIVYIPFFGSERTSIELYLAEKYNLTVATGTDNRINTGSAIICIIRLSQSFFRNDNV
jgi:hypothetical protein